jgi:hypothetical protein
MAHRTVAVAALLVIASSFPAFGTTVLPMKFEALVAEAQTIIRGEIIDVRSDWRDGARDAPIVTKVTVRVLEALKGSPPPQLVLEFLGGTVGDTTLEVSDMPRFTVGERDFLFVNQTERTVSPLVGVFVGRWAIHADALTHREFVTTADGRLLTDVADVDPRPAQSLSTMRRSSSVPLSPVDIESRVREQVRR